MCVLHSKQLEIYQSFRVASFVKKNKKKTYKKHAIQLLLFTVFMFCTPQNNSLPPF